MQVFPALMKRYFCKRSMVMKVVFECKLCCHFSLAREWCRNIPRTGLIVMYRNRSLILRVLLPQWMCQAMNRTFHIHAPLAACGVTEQMLIRPGDRTPMFMHMLLSKTNWCMSHEHCSDCVVSAYVEWLERNCLFCCAVFWYVSGCDLFIVYIWNT